MNIPQLYGNFPNDNIVFFVAADEKYFNLYGKSLISSIKHNFNHSIHFHLYNPSDSTKDFCKKNNIYYSYEYFDETNVETAFEFYQMSTLNEEFTRRRSTMIKIGEQMTKIRNELIRTYYACARFIRLHELLTKPTYVVMLDTDSLVRKPFLLPSKDYDIHIFEKKHKKHVTYTQHLASTIFYTGTEGSFKLIRDHARLILDEFKQDTFYWFLDQETLDLAIQKYKKSPLQKYFVDFDMEEYSFIWCAKGKRKNEQVWIDELTRYDKIS
jgi:hypothetical protein